jgi:hypothetical protein
MWPETHPNCGCAAGKGYFGRGPVQLSWNQNYCNFSEYNYGNNNHNDGTNRKLVDNPDLVAQNPSLAWKAALWYFNTQNGPAVSPWPQVTAHEAITTVHPSGYYGFGNVIRSINGALECNGGGGGKVASRIAKFNEFLGQLSYSGGMFGREGC